MRFLAGLALGVALAGCWFQARQCDRAYRLGPVTVWSRSQTPFCNLVEQVEKNTQ